MGVSIDRIKERKWLYLVMVELKRGVLWMMVVGVKYEGGKGAN